ncbi:hypothetical protein [Spiroplasma culicicola]|uniref:Transmembrane protein n=1 Tax=Spiroplasma culicicola AES-1 TaxID=1276246 RepID=W6A5Q7_9MOLU|nr:hypothetical protein [Spiroplasma culicicola]AHI52468.1 hypothetical protein SCULI_v1c01270 [Spiroplasma culicicola AES-1]
MTIISLGVPIALAIVVLFMFYTSGTIIFEFLRFKVKNQFASIAAGFFAYFTYISILTLPLQLISVLPYIFFVYYLWALTIVYLLFCFIFLKYWLSTNFLSLNLIIFFIIVSLIGVLNYFGYTYINDGSFARHKNTLSILYWLKDNPVSFFNSSTLFNFLDFKPFQGWYTFQISTLILAGAESYQYQDVLVPFTFILDSFLTASIFITMFESLKKTTSKVNTYLLLSISFIIFGLMKTALFTTTYTFWSGETIFIYLVFYTIVLMLKYTTQDYRERHNPIFIGTVLGGYISFSWESSYQVLFLIYCLIFVLQRRYSTNFTKDILKLSIFALTDVVFYNIVSNYYLQSILFGGLLLFLIIVASLMTRRYSTVIAFEVFTDSRIKLVTFLLPLAFMLISIALTLGSNQAFISTADTYLNFLYVWTTIFKNEEIRFWLTTISALTILAISVVWIFIRKIFTTTALTGIVDLILISYLTFYNPIVVKFITLIYPTMLESNGMIMIIQGSILLNVLAYWGINKFDAKTEPQVKVIKKYNWLV